MCGNLRYRSLDAQAASTRFDGQPRQPRPTNTHHQATQPTRQLHRCSMSFALAPSRVSPIALRPPIQDLLTSLLELCIVAVQRLDHHTGEVALEESFEPRQILLGGSVRAAVVVNHQLGLAEERVFDAELSRIPVQQQTSVPATTERVQTRQSRTEQIAEHTSAAYAWKACP